MRAFHTLRFPLQLRLSGLVVLMAVADVLCDVNRLADGHRPDVQERASVDSVHGQVLHQLLSRARGARRPELPWRTSVPSAPAQFHPGARRLVLTQVSLPGGMRCK